MRYVKPKSMGWWGGVICIATGALNILKPETAVYGELVSAFLGSTSAMPPALMIGTGLGIIGIRDKQERG